MAVKVVVEVELSESEYAGLRNWAIGDGDTNPFAVEEVARFAITRFIRQQRELEDSQKFNKQRDKEAQRKQGSR